MLLASVFRLLLLMSVGGSVPAPRVAFQRVSGRLTAQSPPPVLHPLRQRLPHVGEGVPEGLLTVPCTLLSNSPSVGEQSQEDTRSFRLDSSTEAKHHGGMGDGHESFPGHTGDGDHSGDDVEKLMESLRVFPYPQGQEREDLLVRIAKAMVRMGCYCQFAEVRSVFDRLRRMEILDGRGRGGFEVVAAMVQVMRFSLEAETEWIRAVEKEGAVSLDESNTIRRMPNHRKASPLVALGVRDQDRMTLAENAMDLRKVLLSWKDWESQQTEALLGYNWKKVGRMERDGVNGSRGGVQRGQEEGQGEEKEKVGEKEREMQEGKSAEVPRLPISLDFVFRQIFFGGIVTCQDSRRSSAMWKQLQKGPKGVRFSFTLSDRAFLMRKLARPRNERGQMTFRWLGGGGWVFAIDFVMELFEETLEIGLKINENGQQQGDWDIKGQRFAALLTSYLKALGNAYRNPKWKTALATLRRVRELGIDLNVIHYNVVLYGLTKQRQWVTWRGTEHPLRRARWQEALSLFFEMTDAGVTPNEKTFDFLFVALRLAGEGGPQMNFALQLFDEMRVQYNIFPTPFHYSILLNTCAFRIQTPDMAMNEVTGFDSALALWEDMDKLGVKKGADHYIAMIYATCMVADNEDVMWSERGSRKWRYGIELFMEMKAKGIRAGPTAYEALLKVLSSAQGGAKWEMALRVLFSRLKAGQVVTSKMWGFAIHCCAKAPGGSEWRRAFALADDMRRYGHDTDTFVLHHLIQACARSGQGNLWGVAIRLARQIFERGGALRHQAFYQVMKTLRYAEGGGRVKEALEFLKECSDRGDEITEHKLTSLLYVFADAAGGADLWRVLDLFESIVRMCEDRKKNIPKGAFRGVMRACFNAKGGPRFDVLEATLDEARARKHPGVMHSRNLKNIFWELRGRTVKWGDWEAELEEAEKGMGMLGDFHSIKALRSDVDVVAEIEEMRSFYEGRENPREKATKMDPGLEDRIVVGLEEMQQRVDENTEKATEGDNEIPGIETSGEGMSDTEAKEEHQIQQREAEIEKEEESIRSQN
uniref:Pentacotripeptide-repeat region of PRORP domain-containing protein n=1 Tax=Chromera velia CCMP2878 TaxID=1169474 RepID=A0A0G4HN84_9ALVE|eukprot:Cvel_29405.t1-p1 / transcript=Cvel_29405.t1 / gene=Cvel_29405 / organism=Chromera_velia_CCMP2878 / gene_product=Uncharacterized PE-PGRS family protein PE_PGRS10, putative / transcript_product=Uncharacterized PE-PGRS family protein PE_PGRS10, putative / location=Cvel_scaffold4010:7198-10763(-) / protein_length=1041 / sequence_SO=supercontig / SO=protein_coding / is_pseudo=false